MTKSEEVQDIESEDEARVFDTCRKIMIMHELVNTLIELGMRTVTEADRESVDAVGMHNLDLLRCPLPIDRRTDIIAMAKMDLPLVIQQVHISLLEETFLLPPYICPMELMTMVLL
jgi:hypothetical protein